MKICPTSFLLKNILLHEKKPDIGNGVEHSAQKICAECLTRWPSTQDLRSILQVIYQEGTQIAALQYPFSSEDSCFAVYSWPQGHLLQHCSLRFSLGYLFLRPTLE